MKTYMANKDTATHKWYVIDAKGKTLGRLASKIATYLKGKHKPEYTPHVDTGDYIVVINAGGVVLSGNKAQNEEYHYHTGFPGGIKSVSLGELRENNPEKLISLAVKGMMPRTPLGRQMLSKLKIYTGVEHPHHAQQPELLEAE